VAKNTTIVRMSHPDGAMSETDFRAASGKRPLNGERTGGRNLSLLRAKRVEAVPNWHSARVREKKKKHDGACPDFVNMSNDNT